MDKRTTTITPWRTINTIVIQVHSIAPGFYSKRIPEWCFENLHREQSIITTTLVVCIVSRDDLKGLTADSISPTPKHLSKHKIVTDDGKIILSSRGHTSGTDIPFSDKQYSYEETVK